jgi:gliding motility-associated-like protein
VFNGITYTSSTIVRDTLRTASGCDSVYKTTNIIISPTPESVINTLTGCGSVVFNGINHTSSTNIKDTLKNSRGCDSVYRNTIIVVEKFKIDLAANPNPATQGNIVSLATSSALPYFITAWKPATVFASQSATRQTFIGDTSITVWVFARSVASCIDSAKVEVVVNMVDDLFIPNAFSPNNDGNNDVFKVYSTSLRSVDIRLFNQFGELVFQANDNKGWDGSYKGKQQPVTVYSYIISGTFTNGTTFNKKGLFSLIR